MAAVVVLLLLLLVGGTATAPPPAVVEAGVVVLLEPVDGRGEVPLGAAAAADAELLDGLGLETCA